MPVILTPQAPIRPGVSAQMAWSGGPGSEMLTVTVVEDVDVSLASQERVTKTIAIIGYDFSALTADDLWSGVALPPGVPGWANVVVSADRDANGTLTVRIADWSRPNGYNELTVPLPWEGA